MLFVSSKGAVYLFGSQLVREVGIFFVAKIAKMYCLVVNHYAGFPFLFFFNPVHAFIARGVGRKHFGVGHVVAARSYTQVSPIVFQFFSILVINVTCRPFSFDVEKSKSAGEIRLSVCGNIPVSVRHNTASLFAVRNTMSASFWQIWAPFPIKFTCPFVVSHYGVQSLGGERAHSFSRFSSMIRRSVSERLMLSSLALALSQTICGFVKTMERCIVDMWLALFGSDWTRLTLIRNAVKP